MARVDVREEREWLRILSKEILGSLRSEARRVRSNIQDVAPRDSGNLARRGLKIRAGVDAAGPWARVTAVARNPKTRFRYGLSLQQKRHYLERGLDRTPRR